MIQALSWWERLPARLCRLAMIMMAMLLLVDVARHQHLIVVSLGLHLGRFFARSQVPGLYILTLQWPDVNKVRYCSLPLPVYYPLSLTHTHARNFSLQKTHQTCRYVGGTSSNLNQGG